MLKALAPQAQAGGPCCHVQEDTIIFSVLERAQFARNEPVYRPDAIPVPEFADDGRRYSLLEYIMRQTELVHCSSSTIPISLGLIAE